MIAKLTLTELQQHQKLTHKTNAFSARNKLPNKPAWANFLFICVVSRHFCSFKINRLMPGIH